jgi:ribosomal protein S18 acetylase RimI-like enzyme
VRVESLGWRTDLELRVLEGAEVVTGADHVVVRSPENAGYRWGNFMLLAALPGPGEAERWIGRFRAAFPGARHIAIGIDRAEGRREAVEELVALGLGVELSTVLSTTRLRPPARAAPRAVFRPLASDSDWQAAAELDLAASEEPSDSRSHREYLRRRMSARRRVCEAGHGAWFGAFRAQEMHAGLGIFNAGDGLARFQDVDTHPAHRREGLASHLLLAAGRYAQTRLAASTLVIAADPEYHAIDIYRSLGFGDREQHLQFEAFEARSHL